VNECSGSRFGYWALLSVMNTDNSAVRKLYESVAWREALDAILFVWRETPAICETEQTATAAIFQHHAD